jgi:hypothetical protein
MSSAEAQAAQRGEAVSSIVIGEPVFRDYADHITAADVVIDHPPGNSPWRTISEAVPASQFSETTPARALISPGGMRARNSSEAIAAGVADDAAVVAAAGSEAVGDVAVGAAAVDVATGHTIGVAVVGEQAPQSARLSARSSTRRSLHGRWRGRKASQLTTTPARRYSSRLGATAVRVLVGAAVASVAVGDDDAEVGDRQHAKLAKKCPFKQGEGAPPNMNRQ